jgi:phosphatidylserine/phosphatidylglycerophosphate/cardiolipin synthase-like enzyme
MANRKISLIVQPGDSFFPIVEAIDAARTSINITIFRMDDPVIQHAMLDATRRGVRVRALVAANPRGWEKKNRKLLKDLEKAGIETKQPAADSPKTRYHYKILVVDNSTSLILTFNPTRENLHYTRDYGVVVRDESVAAELNRLFCADWDDRTFRPDASSPLVISPYNSREKVGELIQSATKSIHISDAKLRDYQILNVLMAKARAGVDVRILGTDRYYADVFSLLKFRQITRFKMHAKCLLVDGARAFVGSMNLRYENMDKRREVGIIVDDPTIVGKLEDIFSSDWAQKQPTSKEAATTLLTMRPPSLSGAAPVSAPEERFVLLSRRDALSRYPLRNGATTIGRSDDNDVVVSGSEVSRYHARVRVEGDTVAVTDLGSQNGTFVNGEQLVGERSIQPGDILAIADNDEFRLVEI